MKPTFANILAAAAESAGMPQKHVRRAAEHLLRHLFEAAREAGQAKIPGFLSLRAVRLKARRVQNPQTKELMTVPARRVLAARVVGKWRRCG